jgi:hypothetical protein
MIGRTSRITSAAATSAGARIGYLEVSPFEKLLIGRTAPGLVAVLAKRAFARFDGRGRLLTILPAVSALVIVIAGVAMVARALPKVSL